MGGTNLDPDCGLCTLEVGVGPEGGWVLQDQNWSVGVPHGMEIPGWLTAQIRRHAVGTSALNEGEQVSLGPLLAKLTMAITEATGAEKVYAVTFGEAFPHWHILLMARGSAVPEAHRGAALMLHRAGYVDRDAALTTAGRIRALLAGNG
jgi:hypothetical protein